MKRYPLFVGLRYAGAKRRNQLVSFISLVSMAGLTIGVALLIVVLSVMNGFEKEMHQRILGLVPQITVTAYGDEQDWPGLRGMIAKHPDVKAIAPYIRFNAMLLRGTDVETILVFGIDPKQEVEVSIIEQFVEGGALTRLDTEAAGIVLGAALAERMGLEVGDNTTLMLTEQSASGRVKPRYARFSIAGIVNTGTEIDQGLALINMQVATDLMASTGAVQGLRLSVKDTFEAPRVAWELEQSLPYGYSTRDWTRTHGNLYSAIQLSRQLVGMMLLTIIAVAAFNVVSALVMIVTDKQADIAILRSLGASSGGIMSIFIVQGTMIGVIGTGLGALLGVVLSLLVTDVVNALERLFQMQFLNSDVYPINYLPADLRFEDLLLVCSTALVMSVFATLYPAWRAVRVQPAEALRYQ